MGSSKDLKKLIEDFKKILETSQDLKEQLRAQGITLDNLQQKFQNTTQAQMDRLRAAYENLTTGGIIVPEVECGAGQHYDVLEGKCVDNPITPPPVEPPTEPPTTGGGLEKDQYGINKIYADKSGGVLITSDKFVEEEFTRNYASGAPSENSYECEYKDSNKLENEEVTYYVKINGFKNERDTISVKLLGNKHSDGSKDKWLIFQVDTDGTAEDNFQIEDPHPKNTDNHQKTLFTIGESLINKAIGFKAITYIDKDNKRHAETWLDFPTDIDTPANNWRKYIDIADVMKLKKGFLNATNGGALLRIDGTKKGLKPTTRYMSIREIATGEGGTTIPPIPPTIPPVEPPVEPPTPPTIPPTTEGTLDKDGIMIPFKLTGKSVPMTEGNDHRNGQRYSINHKFKNYFIVGYFKLGKGQKQIEHKTDGPNHGSCTKLPECCWCEVDWLIEPKTHDNGRKTVAGEMYISSEHPHPENHPPPLKQESSKIIKGNDPGKWVGFGTAAYQDGEFRHIIGYGDVNPFDAAGKPLNNWQIGVDEIDKGQITNPELAKREMPINYDEGMESEIRMHGATNHDCEIRYAKVYEIIPPS